MLSRTKLQVILYLGFLLGGLPSQGAQTPRPATTKAVSTPQKKDAQKKDESLEQVLKQLEATGKSFQSFSAKLVQKKYTAILKEFDTPESGTFLYARAKDGSALLRQEVTSPAVRILTIKGGLATIYQPALKQAQVINLGKNKDKVEYLALGLGQSPAKLQETFDLKYMGSENVNGLPCSILNLKPKSAAAGAFFSSITLWIKKSNGVPIQQQLQEPNGDYLLVVFSDENLNPKIPDNKFEQKLPADTEKQVVR
jgi:outer membrane lipoprotein-sorting protein